MTNLARRADNAPVGALALAGLGAPDANNRHFVTSLTRTPPNNADHLLTLPNPDPERLQRNIYACSTPFECANFTVDMLARALSITDGNAFFRAYKPQNYLPARTIRQCDDMAVQYASEAQHAVKALDGLNIPPDLLVAAAFAGRAAGRLEAAKHAPTHEAAVDALAALCVRLLANQQSTDKAITALSHFIEAVLKHARQAEIETNP